MTASSASRSSARSKKAVVFVPIATVTALSLAALLSGCGSGNESKSFFTPSASAGSTLFFARTSASRSIGSTGGTVATQSGSAALNVPNGALTQTVTVGIAPTDALPAPAPQGYAVLAETAYTFTAGTLNGLAAPGQLSLRYDVSRVPNTGRATVCKYNRATGTWVPASGVQLYNGVATASVTELGLYAVFIQTLTDSVTASIGAAGGTLAFGDGAASLVIPSGALGQTISATVGKVDEATTPPPADFTLLPGTVFEFGLGDVTLSTPAPLSIRFDPSRIPTGRRAVVCKYNRTTRRWEPVAGETVSGSTIRVSITLGGIYGVLFASGGTFVSAAQGGTISAGDGGFVLEIAPNRLQTNTLITASIADVPAPAPQGYALLDGTVFAVTGDPEIGSADSGLTVRLRFNPARIPTGRRAVVCVYRSGRWIALASSLTSDSVISAQATVGVGIFAVFADLTSAVPVPSPSPSPSAAVPSQYGTLTVDQIDGANIPLNNNGGTTGYYSATSASASLSSTILFASLRQSVNAAPLNSVDVRFVIEKQVTADTEYKIGSDPMSVSVVGIIQGGTQGPTYTAQSGSLRIVRITDASVVVTFVNVVCTPASGGSANGATGSFRLNGTVVLPR